MSHISGPLSPKVSLFASKQSIRTASENPHCTTKSKFLNAEAERHWQAFHNPQKDCEQFQGEKSDSSPLLRKFGHALLWLLLRWTPSLVGGSTMQFCMNVAGRLREPLKYNYADPYAKGGFYHSFVEEGSKQFSHDKVVNLVTQDWIRAPGATATVLLPNKSKLEISGDLLTTCKEIAPKTFSYVADACTKALGGDEQKALRLLSSLNQVTETDASVFLMEGLSGITLSLDSNYPASATLLLEEGLLVRDYTCKITTPNEGSEGNLETSPIARVRVRVIYDLSDPNNVTRRLWCDWEKLAPAEANIPGLNAFYADFERRLATPAGSMTGTTMEKSSSHVRPKVLFAQEVYDNLYADEIRGKSPAGFYHEFTKGGGSKEFTREQVVYNALTKDILGRAQKMHKVTITLPDDSSIVLNPLMNPLIDKDVKQAELQIPNKPSIPLPSSFDVTAVNAIGGDLVTTCTEALEGDEQKALRLLSTLGQITKTEPSTFLLQRIFEKQEILISIDNQQHEELSLSLSKQTLQRQLSFDLSIASLNRAKLATVDLYLEYNLADPDHVEYSWCGVWKKVFSLPVDTSAEDRVTAKNIYSTLEEIMGGPVATS